MLYISNYFFPCCKKTVMFSEKYGLNMSMQQWSKTRQKCKQTYEIMLPVSLLLQVLKILLHHTKHVLKLKIWHALFNAHERIEIDLYTKNSISRINNVQIYVTIFVLHRL